MKKNKEGEQEKIIHFQEKNVYSIQNLMITLGTLLIQQS